MAIGSVISRLAQAYLEMQRRKLGIPQREQEETAAADTSALRRAQAAQALRAAEYSGEDRASQVRLRDAQAAALSENAASAKALREAQAALANSKATNPPPQKKVERSDDFGGFRRITYTDGTTEDVPKTAAPKAPGAGGGLSKTGYQIIRNGKPEVWFPPANGGSLPEGASFAIDARNERKTAVAATSPLSNVEVMANQVEGALNKFDETSLLHPIDKAVAQSSYKNLLNALAVPWGRLLGDTRISDQDRTSYARSVGEPSFFLKEIAPDVARQRLSNLREVIADIRAKYGDVLEESSGMLAGVGGGAKLHTAQPGGGEPAISPNLQRVLDLLRKRNAAGR